MRFAACIKVTYRAYILQAVCAIVIEDASLERSVFATHLLPADNRPWRPCLLILGT